MVEELSPVELRELIKHNQADIELIDVRDTFEYQQLHLKGSKLIPLSSITARMQEINWDKKVIFICRSGNRSGMAARALASQFGKVSSNLRYGLQECLQDGGSEYLNSPMLARQA